MRIGALREREGSFYTLSSTSSYKVSGWLSVVSTKTTAPPHPGTSSDFHNLAVNPARPPATTDDGISFDKAAGLKRFHSHSHHLHTFLQNAGWEGGLSKSRAVLFLIKIATTETARETSTLPPTKNNASLCVSHLCALFVTTILQ